MKFIKYILNVFSDPTTMWYTFIYAKDSARQFKNIPFLILVKQKYEVNIITAILWLEKLRLREIKILPVYF